MSARVLIVYTVTGTDETRTFPTRALAVDSARARVAEGEDCVEVQRVTIPGPFNRALVCRLLGGGGYASELVTVWTPAAGAQWTPTTSR